MGKGNKDHPRQGAKHEETKRCNTVGCTYGFDKHSVGKKVPGDWKLCKSLGDLELRWSQGSLLGRRLSVHVGSDHVLPGG